MSPLLGWGLAAVAVVGGFVAYGWQGLVLAISVVVFWLLLQFSRALRVMRGAAANPVGHTDNAVMLQARLRPGMRMLQVVTLTRSLGRKVGRRSRDLRLAGRRRRRRAGRCCARTWSAKCGCCAAASPRPRRPPTPKIDASSPLTEGNPMSMSDRDGKIWMDGALVDWRDAKIHVLSHTLHYGCGAFEGVRAYNTAQGTAIFRLREHTERLFNSAKILRMKIPFTPEQVMEAQREVVRANKLESCYLRPLVWIGDEKLGVSPKGNTIHLMVAAWPWGAYLGEEGLKRGIRVKTSSYTRHHVNITMTQAKAVSNYTNSILANMEATDDGYDEALLLDSTGFVSEGAGENLFIIKKGVVYTPDLSAGALERHHARHHLRDLQRPGPEAGRKAHHARRGLHLRRGLLHRHRRRGDADPRTRPHRARRRQPRARSPRRSRRRSSTSSTAATRSTPSG